MPSSLLARVLSTWLRVTAVAWLVTISARVTVNMVNPRLTYTGDYLLSVALVMLGIYIAAVVLGCETKPYAESMVAALVVVVLAQAVPEPLQSPGIRVLVYTVSAFLIVLMLVHGVLELRSSHGWGSAQLLAPVTVLAWGVASEFGSLVLSSVVGATMPALVVSSALAALVFAIILEAEGYAPEAANG